MLNVFPQLLVFNFFAPTFLRIVAAGIFFYLAWFHATHRKAVAQELSPLLSAGVAKVSTDMFALIEGALAVLLFIGLWTQVAALVGAIVCLKVFILRKRLHAISPLSHLSYILLLVICLSLLLTGAGAIAFDIPL